jgi:hypothetical protein
MVQLDWRGHGGPRISVSDIFRDKVDTSLVYQNQTGMLSDRVWLLVAYLGQEVPQMVGQDGWVFLVRRRQGGYAAG